MIPAAIANAFFNATGERLRKLGFDSHLGATCALAQLRKCAIRSGIRVRLCLFAINSIEKAALFQFANEAVVDKIIDIDLADARILRFQ